ncbi:MAG: NifU family protein [Patescibacteria group bacterium]
MIKKENIEKILDEIRPVLQSHGGDIQLVEFDEKNRIVKVKLVGGCASCPMAEITLKDLIEQTIKEKIPEIQKIEAI